MGGFNPSVRDVLHKGEVVILLVCTHSDSASPKRQQRTKSSALTVTKTRDSAH